MVLYGGTDPVSGIKNDVAAQAYVAAHSDAYSLDQTKAFKYLDDSSTKALIQQAADQVKAELATQGITLGLRQQWAIQESIWRAVSTELVEQSNATSVVTFVKGADALGTFGQDEAPAALGNSTITSANGSDIAPLRGSPDPYGALSFTQSDTFVDNFFKGSKTGGEITDGSSTGGDLVPVSDLLADRPMPSDPANQALMIDEGVRNLTDASVKADAEFSDYNGNFESGFKGTDTYGYVETIGMLGRTLTTLGYGLLAYDVLTSSAKAMNEVQAGDYAGASQTMADLAGRVGGGIEGAELGAATGFEIGLVVGGPVGAAAGALIGGVAGALGGAYLGQQAVRAIEDSAANALKSLVHTITGEDPDSPDSTQAAIEAMGYANVQISPLVLDLTGNGIQLTGLNGASPYFDLTNDGFARRTGWVGAGMGILTLDPNDAAITNITQLFGNATTDGFQMLSKLDSNSDGKIDAKDSAFSSLRVWVDANRDATTQSGELFTLTQLGITSINLHTTRVNQTLAGNTISTVSSYTLADGTTRQIADVWFNNSASDTRPMNPLAVTPDAAALPQLAGRGTMLDLRSAMTQDSVLLAQLQTLTQQTSTANPGSLESIVQSILFQWAGVSSVSPGARGGYMDARRLEFIERYLGQNFDSPNDGTVPAFRASSYVQQAWNEVFDASLARLVLQVPALSGLLPGFQYDASTDKVISTKALADVLADAYTRLGNLTTANLANWDLVLRVADAQRIDIGMSVSAFHNLALQATTDAVASIANAIAAGLAVTVDSNGRVVETGSAVGDTFYAGQGVGVLNGNGGGNNFAEILPQNDVFHYAAGDGSVEIVELDSIAVAPTNTLIFDGSIRASDITVSTGSNNAIVLTYQYGGQVTLDQMAAYANNGVQSVVFGDGTVWSRAQILQMAAPKGSNTTQYLQGTSGADLLDGQGGDDYVTGGGGSDTFVFNAGYGHLDISEQYLTGQAPVLKLGSGITASGLHVGTSATGRSLVISDGTAGDQITLEYMLSNGYGVDSVQFADGTTWTRAQLLAREMVGSTGNDSLYGTAGADLLDGGGGTDVAGGNGGNDTFVFNAGYGHLEINEQDFSATAANVLRLGTGMSAASVQVRIDGNDILLTDGITGDLVRIDGMVSWGYDGVQTIRFADGTEWSAAQVGLLARQIDGTPNGDTLYGTSSGADIIDGKGGSDLVYGNGGSDTFVFNAGYGRLEINENVSAGQQPILKLGSGIAAADLHVVSDGGNLVLHTGGVNDRIVLDGMWDNASWGVAVVQLADGTVITRDQLTLMEMTGSSASDVLYGTSGADRIDGKGGKDTIYSYAGSDTYVFNAGYGQLEIHGSFASGQAPVLALGGGITASSVVVTSDGYNMFLADGVTGDKVTLDGMWSYSNEGVASVQFADGSSLARSQLLLSEMTGTSANDIIYGTSGADRLDGRGGNDTLYGQGGNDTFVFGSGYGGLVISNSFDNGQAPALELGAGINASSIHVSAIGSDLILSDGVAGDQITLRNAWSNSSSGVASVHFSDGSSLSRAQLITMEMTGTTGNDTILGTSGGDLIDGKGGNDSVNGNGGNDTFVFNSGYGHLEINEGFNAGQTPILQLGAGITAANVQVGLSSSTNSIVLTDGMAGDQVQIDYAMSSPSNSGVTSVVFADGTVWTQAQLLDKAHHINGTTGNDTLNGTSGSAGADVFDGKGGNDSINGNGGSDTFVFNSGYGKLTIYESYNSDQVPMLQLGAGIMASSLQVRSSGSDLLLTDGVSGDQITLQSMWSSSSSGVASVALADGTTLSRTQLIQMSMIGTSGAETIRGTSGADLIDGKGGNDSVIGNGGNDTFVFNSGYGHLEINEGFNAGQTPILQLGTGITAANVQVGLSSSTNSIVLMDGVAGDQIQIDYAMSSPSDSGVTSVVFADGTVWTQAQLLDKAHHINGTTGNDTLNGTSGSTGADIIDGKGGNDSINGNGGSDTFVFNSGYGQLTVYDSYSGTQAPVLQLGAGITTSSLQVRTNGSDLLLTDGVAGDQINLQSMWSYSSNGVASVALADGTTLNRAQLIQMQMSGTSGAETIRGTPGADLIDGKGGNDSVIGNGGNDTFVYNSGYGKLEINESYTTGQAPILQLGAGITANTLHVALGSYGSLVLTDGVTGDQVTLDNATSTGGGVSAVQFADGSTLTSAQLIVLAHQISGTTGNDTVSGTSSADLLDGKGGNDSINGNGGNDTFVFNSGYGHLEINEGFNAGQTPILQLGTGITAANVQVSLSSSTNSIVLTDGVTGDQILIDYAMSSPTNSGVTSVVFADGTVWTQAQLLDKAHHINGTTGNDTLNGAPGASGGDVIDGKGGNDSINGNGGSDTFVFNSGYGKLTIYESYNSGQAPVLQLGAGITAAALQVRAIGSDLVLTDGVAGDQITLQSMWSYSSNGVASVALADGTTLSRAQLIQMQMTGTSGAETIRGTSSGDLIDGKGGNDSVIGNGGNDTFVYNSGYGKLEINESYSTGQAPVLRLGAGITAASVQVGLNSSRDSIVLTDAVAGDQILIDYAMSSPSNSGVASVVFADGTVWTQAQLLDKAHHINGTTGNDTLNGTSGSLGADVIDGKGGNDSINGNGGSDTFVFNSGYGQLTVYESYNSGQAPVLQLGAGITAAALQVRTNGSDLLLTDGVAGDQINLQSMWSYSSNGVASVALADGTNLSRAQLIQMQMTGTPGAETIRGTSSADVIDGKGGNDSATGYGGNDTFVFNSGYGHLTINENFSTGQAPILQLGAGIAAGTLKAAKSGSDLVLTDGVVGDQITLIGEGSYTNNGVSLVQLADGTSYTRDQLLQMTSSTTASSTAAAAVPRVDSLVHAMASFGTPSAATITGDSHAHAANDALLLAAHGA